MNFFKFFLTLFFSFFLTVSYADNHSTDLSESVKEVVDELQEDEDVPLNLKKLFAKMINQIKLCK